MTAQHFIAIAAIMRQAQSKSDPVGYIANAIAPVRPKRQS